MYFRLHELACADKTTLHNIQQLIQRSSLNEPKLGEFQLSFTVSKKQEQCLRQYVFYCILDAELYVQIQLISLNKYTEGKFEPDWIHNTATSITSCFSKERIPFEGKYEAALHFLLHGLYTDFQFLNVNVAMQQH